MFTLSIIVKGVLARVRGDLDDNDYLRIANLYGLRDPVILEEWKEFREADSRKLHHLQDVVTEWFKLDGQRAAKLWQDTVILGVVLVILL